MSDVKWIKLTTDMFDNKKIKHLRRLPDGNSVVLIWVMLLTMAGRCNAGGMIFLTENIPYTPKMLADELGFEENTIILALNALEQLGMISTDTNCLMISDWENHQNVDGLEKIREQTRQRVAKSRAKQKLLGCNAGCNATCNATVTQSNAADIDIDKDIEEEIDYISIVDYLNAKAGTKFKPGSDKTRRLIRARWNEGFRLDDFKTVIENKCKSWLGSDMEKFLRPETLFGTKFESYLNERNKNGHTGSSVEEHTEYGIVF
ncbi:phage replisome organizer N-terminal domain-containing protein [Treponema sp.]|uniref:phage replisome organizer N-terminal domain-containing protein n=1 Tax=Treponema sp. TaxID=166 RepID=UPI00388D8932